MISAVMDESLSPEDRPAASRAIALYVAGGYPGDSDEARARAVVKAFGHRRGQRLVQAVEAIMAEMDALTQIGMS